MGNNIIEVDIMKKNTMNNDDAIKIIRTLVNYQKSLKIYYQSIIYK